MKRPNAQTQKLSLAVIGSGLALGLVLQVLQALRATGFAG